MQFVIIGGDAAGMSAASRARRNLKDLKIIVLEKTFDVSYSACGMPYNIADPDRGIDDLVVREAHIFREKQGIDLRTGYCVEKIEPKEKVVIGHDPNGKEFIIPYDKLLIATGATAIVPNIPGFNSDRILKLKNLADGRKIKRYMKENDVRQAVIVGMGYIALEMCEALQKRGIQVSMIKPRSVFLPGFNAELSKIVKDEVSRHDVNIHLGQNIERIESIGDAAFRIICEKAIFDCQMVLVAAGIMPNSALAADAGLDLGPKESIAVGKDLLTSDANIFSAGDCSDAYHIVTGEKTWNPLALWANRAGYAVADNLAGKGIRLDGVAGTAVFKVFDLQVARTGLNKQEALDNGFDPVEVVIKSRTKAHAHPGSDAIYVHMIGDRKTGRILGTQMVGYDGAAHRINSVAVALHQKMTVQSYSQCDMAYSPPFGPVWDPTLTAANQLLKKL